MSGVTLQAMTGATPETPSHAELGVFAAGVPAVLTVDSAADVNDGNFSAGHLSLREAVFLANSDPDATTIKFSNRLGTLRLSQVGDNTADNSALAVTSNVTIVGAAQGTTLVGTGSTGDLRLFRVLAGGDLTLQRLTMTNWRTDTNGGVIVIDPAGTANLTDCTLSNNFAASQGGAIYNAAIFSDPTDPSAPQSDPNLLLANCTLSGNRAHDGGAYNGGGQTFGGNATFTNCIFKNNSAVDRGGAIALYNSFIQMQNCTLAGNVAHQGGAVAGGDGVFLDSTFVGNKATDGGAIFFGIGGGGASGLINFAGGPGSISVLHVDGCTFTNNVAEHRGGGIFSSPYPSLVGCTFTGNRAQQGGGLFFDGGEGRFFTKTPAVEPERNIFTANIATETGGGVFVVNGDLRMNGWTFTNNVAKEGAAVFNNIAYVSITNSTVVNNRSQQGTQLFNHLGVLSLTHSTVSDIGQMKFISAHGVPESTFVATIPGLEPAAIIPSAKDTIVTAADGIRYSLTADRLLLRQIPGCNWLIVDDEVQSYKLAPNGEIYWLNDRGDLYRSKAAAAGDLIGLLVKSYAMDKNGTVYVLSSGVGPGNFAAWHSLTSPLLDPVEDPVGSGPLFGTDPPTPEEVTLALGLGGPDIHDLKTVVEPFVDKTDGVSYYPNIGLAQMHHVHYICTAYYSTDLNGPSIAVIYMDRDQLHRYVMGDATASAPANQAARAMTGASEIATVSDASRSDNIRSMWTGADGTIYKLGGDYNGQHLVGTPPTPLVLWILPPGGNWQPLLRVYAAEVAPDNTIFVLDTNHELQRLTPGTSQWSTIASGVQSFTMLKDGTVYALDDSGRLLREQHAPHSSQWALSTLDTGVTSFAVTANGVLYELTSRHELKRFTGIGHFFVPIGVGVSSLEKAADGTIYSFNQWGQLKRLERTGSWSIVGSGIQSYQLDADGVMYTLNRQHQLSRMTAGGHWSLVDVDVQSFVVAPNALRNVYILTTHHELKRLEAGYSWLTLRTDVTSLSIDAEGIVTARDLNGGSWLYWSPFTVPILGRVLDASVLTCQNPPMPDDVLRLLHIPAGPDVNVSIVDTTEDQVDPPRSFSNLGDLPPVRLHHCHYQCTVDYTDSLGAHAVVIDVDDDHLILA